MSYILNSLLAVSIVSLIALIGIISIRFKTETLKKYTSFLVALSIGTLVGDVFIHIIPEIYEEADHENIGIPLSIIAGILIFYSLEKFLHWSHHHLEEEKEHNHIKAFGKVSLIGDAMHNFIDGMLIASAFYVDVKIGIATTIAVLIHEIPQELGDFGVLIHSGMTKTKALVFNFVSALTSIFGVLIFVFVSESFSDITTFILGMTAGGFLYIAIADLIPELKPHTSVKRSIVELVVLIVGILIMFGLSVLE